ncbi:DUF1348 family protein [Streptomyces sp. NPDC005151]
MTSTGSRSSRAEGCRFIKELTAFDANRVAAPFAYEWHDDSGNRFRSPRRENGESLRAGS